MLKQTPTRQRRHERGQTMIFVAISIVSLLGMAALAIDIVTLYGARSEIQRAADAAALAGAKAIADSGFTTLPAADSNYSFAQSLAQSMATTSISALLNATPPINLVARGRPALSSVPFFDFTTHPGSYQVTVSLRRDNLPTFFSKVWRGGFSSVTATATAEVYNPANLPTFTPISPTSVKPWLVANADPTSLAALKPPFIDTATGTVEPGVIGKQFNLTADCQIGSPCVLVDNPPKVPATSILPGNPQVEYVPLQVVANSKNICPACAGASDYEQSIECADVTNYVAPSCGGGATNATWDNSNNPGGPAGFSALGAECLTHAANSGASQGQDTLDPSPWPGNPMKITAQSGPQSGSLVATSNSIVTIPIIDGGSITSTGGPVTVIGFMQAFINQVQDGTGGTTAGDINITVLNIAGCSVSANGANPVVGGAGTSPVPVRLIASP